MLVHFDPGCSKCCCICFDTDVRIHYLLSFEGVLLLQESRLSKQSTQGYSLLQYILNKCTMSLLLQHQLLMILTLLALSCVRTLAVVQDYVIYPVNTLDVRSAAILHSAILHTPKKVARPMCRPSLDIHQRFG